MTITKRRRLTPVVVVAGLVLGGLALCVWAWRDGGREPVRDIVISLKVPELPK